MSEPFIDNHNVRLAINLSRYLANTKETRYLLEYLMHVKSEYFECEDTNITTELIDEANNNITELLFNEEEQAQELKTETKTEGDFVLQEDRSFAIFYEMVNNMPDNDICLEFIEMAILSRGYYSFKDFSNELRKYVKYSDSTSPSLPEKKYDAVKLVTTFGSKGMEWDVSIIKIDKLKHKEYTNIEDLDEARRVLFVASTRAKLKNYIIYNTNQDKSKAYQGRYTDFVNEVAIVLHSDKEEKIGSTTELLKTI